jgi:hypothetical protein
MELLNGMRFTGKNGENYELTISPILKNTFVDNMINLTNKDTGVVERLKFGKFRSLKANTEYKYIKRRVDIVIEPGKVASGEAYFDANDNTLMYTVDGFLDSVESIDEVIIIYNIGVVYDDDKIVESFRQVKYLKKFYQHEICNVDGERYIANGVTGNHVELRKLDDVRVSTTTDNYGKVASIDEFTPFRIVYAFTSYGFLPVLHVHTKVDQDYYSAVINEKYLISLYNCIVFPISKTALTLPIRTKDDIVKLANVGVEMFAKWAYDYKSMLPAINNVFGKDE